MNILQALSELMLDKDKVFQAKEKDNRYTTTLYTDTVMTAVTDHGAENLEFCSDTVVMATTASDDTVLIINDITMELDFVEVEKDDQSRIDPTPCEAVLRL